MSLDDLRNARAAAASISDQSERAHAFAAIAAAEATDRIGAALGEFASAFRTKSF